MLSIMLATVLCFQDKPKAKIKQPLKKPDPVVPAKTFGDYEVSVSKVVIKPAYKSFGTTWVPIAGPFLFVHLEIKNKSETKRTKFSGWSQGGASAKDEFGNTYSRGEIAERGVSIDGQWHESMIYPGQTVTDTVWLEMPVAKAKSVKISLEGQPIGETKDVVFEVERSKWIDETKPATKKKGKKT